MSKPDELHIKRLEVLQNIIARMAQNSFAIKGWAVAVMTALLAFNGKETERWFAVYALYPALAFWGLDAYYLMQERLFRELSERGPTPGQAFNFKTEPTLKALLLAVISPTVFPIYVFAVLMAFLIAYFAK